MSYYQDVFMRSGHQVSVYRNVETGRFAAEEEVITYTFLWHSMGDACPKCASLNGQIFEDQDIYQKMLWSPVWGDLMDLDTGWMFTHPNCRCQVEVQVNADLMQLSELNEYQNLLELMI